MVHRQIAPKKKKTLVKKSNKSDHRRHLLHHILVELSFTGTIARSSVALLVGLTVLVTQIAAFYVDGGVSKDIGVGFVAYLQPLIYTFVFMLSGFIVFDMLYVFIRRLLPLKRWVDSVLLVLVETGIIIAMILPVIMVMRWSGNISLGTILLLSPLFVLAVRVLLGVSYRHINR